MNNEAAKKLLEKISQAKHAGVIEDAVNRQNNEKSRNLIAKALLTALGGGAAIRGLQGFRTILGKPGPTGVPHSSEFEMPYRYDEEEKQADAFDNPWTIPALTLGLPAAFYGGWKGIDKLLDRQRKAMSEDELEAAKQEYRDALLATYKEASDERSTEELLDGCFQKAAEKSLMDSFSRAGNIGKGLALTYGIGAPLAAYALVNSKMKATSRKALLEKAIAERARRRAQQQPSELYALPEPVAISEDEDEE